MCGIIALISKKLTGFSELELKLFNQALYTNALRGADSTGIFSITKEGNIHLIKDNVDANTFLKSNDIKKEFENYYLNSRILVGHNRAATKGNITDKNAHPFLIKDTVLVHNGTIYEHKLLANTETDSEAICSALSEKPYKEVLENISGAFALIFYKANEKKLYVIKNKERPLWIISTNEFDFICSEPKMGEWLYTRLYKKELEAQYFEDLKPYFWNIDSLKEGFNTEKPIKEKKNHFFLTNNLLNTSKIYGINKINLYKNQIIPIYIDFIFKKQDNTYEVLGSNNNYADVTFYYTINTENPPKRDSLVYTKIINIPQQNRIFVEIIPEIIELTGINNTQIIIEKGTTCSKCKKILSEEEDQNTTWINVHTNKSKTILCKSCIKSIPKLYNEYKDI